MAGIPLYTSSPINTRPADPADGQRNRDQTRDTAQLNFTAGLSDSPHPSHRATKTSNSPVPATRMNSMIQTESMTAEPYTPPSQPNPADNVTRNFSPSRTNQPFYMKSHSTAEPALPTLNTNAHYCPTPSSTNNSNSANSSSHIRRSPARDLSHPPGYRQGEAAFYDRPVVEAEYTPSVMSSPLGRGQSILDSGSMPNMVSGESPVWDTAISWAKAAGKRLSTTEAQVWKYVNGEK